MGEFALVKFSRVSCTRVALMFGLMFGISIRMGFLLKRGSLVYRLHMESRNLRSRLLEMETGSEMWAQKSCLDLLSMN